MNKVNGITSYWQNILLISFCVIIGKLNYAQQDNFCATFVSPKAQKNVSSEFHLFYEDRIKAAEIVQNSDDDWDEIKIKRWVVKDPVFDSWLHPLSRTYLTNEEWEAVLTRTNQAFEPAKIRFLFDEEIGVISNHEYFEFNMEDPIDRNIFKEIPGLPKMINCYVVFNITNNRGESPSGFSSLPFHTSERYDVGEDSRVPGNYFFVSTWGVRKYSATFVHELGHFFGLLHTFESVFGRERIGDVFSSKEHGDKISDTKPNHERIHEECGCSFAEFEMAYPSLQECGGNTYEPDYDNYMSYFSDKLLKRFSPMQIEFIRRIKKKYRSYLTSRVWALPVTENLSENKTIKVKFTALKIINAETIYWSFPGGNPSSYIGPSVEVVYQTSGRHSYTLRVENSTINDTYELTDDVEISPVVSEVSKPLPFSVDFEEDFSTNNQGLTFNNLPFPNKDCNSFFVEYLGAFGTSSKSLVKNSFDVGQETDSIGSADYFETPYLQMGNIKKLMVSFDLAYADASLTEKSDVLELWYWTERTGWVKEWELLGKDLRTVQNPISNNFFIPSINDWRHFEYDLSKIIEGRSDQSFKIRMQVITGKGNRLYLDNFRVYGISIADIELEFDRITHMLKIIWSDFSSDETNYIVERKSLLDNIWNEVAIVDPNVTIWTEQVRDGNNDFEYRVRAVSASNPFPTSSVYFRQNLIPERPTMLQTIVEDRNVGIKWTDPNDYETAYDLYYSYSKGAPMTLAFSLPANTPEYLHRNVPSNSTIYYMVRARERNFVSEPSDTIEALVNVYNVQSRINRVEYFLDQYDPGLGSGVDLNLTGSKEETDASGLIPVSDLSNGVHSINIRARDNKGYWSNIQSFTFLKLNRLQEEPLISKLEYALDANTPNPNWVKIEMDPGLISQESIIFTINDQVEALKDGIHFITIRALDNQGYWSDYFHQAFLKMNGSAGERKVISLEYTIDNGLLIGNGTAVVLTPGQYTNVSVDLPPLANGKHNISFKAKDDGGYWSNISIDSFVVYDQRFCEKNALVQYSVNVPDAKSFFWQENTGSGWRTLSNDAMYNGTRTGILTLSGPPTSWYGYQYRCIVNGVPQPAYTLKFGDTWTGAVDDDWNNPSNWCCYGVPDQYTDVFIDPSTTRKPKITSSSVCRSLTLKPGALLSIEDGQTLEIKGQ